MSMGPAAAVKSTGKVDEFDEGSVVIKTYKSSDFRWGAPLYKGETTACFNDGILFRIVEKNNRWSFYNDTLNLQIRVQFTFGEGSTLKALDNTKLESLPNGTYRATVTVYPMESELFVVGEPNGYTSNICSQTLSEDYLKDMALQDKQMINMETAALYQAVGDSASTDDMVKACVDNKIKFVDFAFPPDQKSLQIGSMIKLKVLPWERPCMYLSDENAQQARLFRNGVHPVNIDEGELGDSWLTGGIAAFAEFPEMIRNIFRHPESVEIGRQEREMGIYRVRLNKNGWWTNVVLDDYLPVAGGRPKFARSKGDPRELWVSMIEKAFAKVFGGYGFIIAGNPLHCLQDISGFPCSSFDNAFVESAMANSCQLFDLLKQYADVNKQIIFTTPTRDTIMTTRGAQRCLSPGQAEVAYKKANLLLGHTYAVVKLGIFEDHRLRLIQFRNPWTDASSSSDWIGSWNKNDKNWQKYPEVASYFDFDPTDDGTFFMEWVDVQDYFCGCGVCFIQHPTYDYRIRGTFFQNVPTTCLEISVLTPTVMSIVLSQEDKCGTDKPEYAPLMISVAHGMGAMTPMAVDLNSGFNHDLPTSEFSFLQSRDCSMFYKFLPECSPYMVIPRAMSPSVRLPYTLGILSPHEIGKQSSKVRVAFRALAPENRVFENFQKFNNETLATETEFQAMGPSQFFPDIYVGTVIQTSDEF